MSTTSEQVTDPNLPIGRLIIVRGRVQGVGFRYSAIASMQRNGVAGTARNLPDGAVELHVEGVLHAVDAFTEWAQAGPIAARVDELEMRDEQPFGLSGTDILR